MGGVGQGEVGGGSGLVFVPVYDGLHFLHDLFVRNAGCWIGEGGFDLLPEPSVIFGRVFRRHQMWRRVEVGLSEGIIFGHRETIADCSCI